MLVFLHIIILQVDVFIVLTLFMLILLMSSTNNPFEYLSQGAQCMLVIDLIFVTRNSLIWGENSFICGFKLIAFSF